VWTCQEDSLSVHFLERNETGQMTPELSFCNNNADRAYFKLSTKRMRIFLKSKCWSKGALRKHSFKDSKEALDSAESMANDMSTSDFVKLVRGVTMSEKPCMNFW
jgi:hypothetical protein